MYHYDICTVSDEEIFEKQCHAPEKKIPGIVKGAAPDDVDGSGTQIYTLGDNKITVHNSMYIDSDIELEHFFN